MTTVHTLASGSSGNAAVLSCGDTHLLIDAGISCRRITVALKELGLTPADLTAILITHTHSDHISGLNTLLKKTDCPILATPRTCRELDCRFPGIEPRLMEAEGAVTLGEVDIQPIPTSHDASGSCGWRLDTEGGSVGLLTDTGYVTDEALDLLPGVDMAILEFNHDVEALCSGPYPYYLKQRILGLQGHLCNEDAAQFAVTLAENGASDIVLAHLSRDNNTPTMALNAAAAALDGAQSALELSLSMAGILCLWSGVMEILNVCGLSRRIAMLFRPLLRRLLPNASRDEETLAAVSANVSANLLGLGNAATPLGIQAARRMARSCGGTASDELCLLVVLNTASIQLLPTTVASVRAAFGSAAPFDILPAVWISSLASVTVGLLTARLLSRRKGGPA